MCEMSSTRPETALYCRRPHPVAIRLLRESTRTQNAGAGHWVPHLARATPTLLWWKSRTNPAQYGADGFGGQQIMVLPDADRASPWRVHRGGAPGMTPYRIFMPAIRER